MSRPLRRLGLCSFFGAPLFIGLDALYTYLFSVSIVFCKSSQYINRNKSNCREGKLRRAASRFAKPHKFPKRNGFILFASTKRTGSSRRAAALSTPGDGSKLYRLYFFVTFPTFVPKPVCGATRFFGCFEPVRKGSCSADARPLLFENGML